MAIKLPIRVRITNRNRDNYYIYQDKKLSWWAAMANGQNVPIGDALGVKDTMAVRFALDDAERGGSSAVIKALREQFEKQSGRTVSSAAVEITEVTYNS